MFGVFKKMSKLSTKGARKIIKYNRQRLYHLSKKYVYLNLYLSTSLRGTLFGVYKYLYSKVKEYIIDKHRYCFVIRNSTLTKDIRKKYFGAAISNRQMNLLCAIGFFNKIEQNPATGSMLEVNALFLTTNPQVNRPINAYCFRKYTDKELAILEENAKRLYLQGVTATNFSQNMLVLNGLGDLSRKALPSNNKKAPVKKKNEYNSMKYVMDFLIDEQGYFTKDEVKANLDFSDSEVDKLFTIFKNDINKQYVYQRPTKEQITKFGLTSLKYIYVRKENDE